MIIQEISDTKLDIIGDIHGEISALNALLEHLGYDEVGAHPENRKLVFVGDLVDRGENSWAVYKKVRTFMEHGNAYCILGNHELNLLITDKRFNDGRPKVKAGNEWFHGLTELVNKSDPTSIQPQFLLTSATERKEIQEFLRPLPLVITGPGIRIVHSCWNDKAIATLKDDSRDPEDIHDHYEAVCKQMITSKVQDYLNQNPGENPKNLAANSWLASLDRSHEIRIFAELTLQNDNPVKVITSGLEKRLEPDQEPYEAGKKMRYVQRDRWWTRYTDEEIVVCGHYWRTVKDEHRTQITFEDKKDIPPTFLPHEGSFDWLGKRRNVMCIDYSVGKRFLERHHGATTGATGAFLAALRYTRTDSGIETHLFFDDGTIKEITP